MIEFEHTCKSTGNQYRTRIPLAVTFEMRYYAPCDEGMFVWIDADGKYVGGGTLRSEMTRFKFLPEDAEPMRRSR